MPVIRRLNRCGGLVWVLALIATPAQGETPERLNVRSDTSCPSSEDVASQLAPLMPQTELVTAEAANAFASDAVASNAFASDAVTVRETPGGLRVEVSGEDKEFRALPGDCTERARMVAVFVHLKYSPLLVVESAPPTPPESPTPSEPAATAAPEPTPVPQVTAGGQPVASTVRGGASPNRWGASLGIAATMNLDARTLGRSLDYGLSARGWMGDEWALALGVSVLLPSEHDFISGLAADGATLTVWRTPADVAVRYQRRGGNTSLYGELGLETALLRVSRLTAPGQAYRLEWGPRAALGIGRVLGGGITIGASLFATFIPMPYEFRLEPRDALGTSPAAWGGVSLGVWF